MFPSTFKFIWFDGQHNDVSLLALDDWLATDEWVECDACLTECGELSSILKQYFHGDFLVG